MRTSQREADDLDVDCSAVFRIAFDDQFTVEF
jgi:hypothetical protein